MGLNSASSPETAGSVEAAGAGSDSVVAGASPFVSALSLVSFFGSKLAKMLVRLDFSALDSGAGVGSSDSVVCAGGAGGVSVAGTSSVTSLAVVGSGEGSLEPPLFFIHRPNVVKDLRFSFFPASAS